MVDKVNGSAKAGEFLGKQLDFFSVATIGLSGGSSAANKKLAEKIIETVSINGQPIMLSGTMLSTSNLVDGNYTLKFAVEHAGSNAASGLVADRALATGEGLEARINALAAVAGAAVTIVTEL